MWSMLFPLIIVCISMYSTAFCHVESSRIIETKYGLVRGARINTDDGNSVYHAYTSIPYAEPPLGQLRFEPPVPLQRNWTHILNATHTASKCMQWSTLSGDNPIMGSEDCLYLNVFVPEMNREAMPLPVMVFIHGGGLMWGSSDFYGETYIMQNGGLILVSLNYRLGPFGFLSTEDEQIAGNMGFKDQVLALRWVYENIQYFGGDNARILLSGWSAGGASVSYHMVSELTDAKWFSSAISFSGTALCPCHTIYPGEALKKFLKLSKYLNCTNENKLVENIKNCLKMRSAVEIIQQLPNFYKFSNHPFAIFGPVIERFQNKSPFLVDQIGNFLKNGKIKRKPWLLAQTSEDGAFGTAEFLKRDENGKELIYILNKRWSELAPILFFFDPQLSQEEQKKLAIDLRTRYFGDKEINLETYESLERLYNDKFSIKHINDIIQLYVNFTDDVDAYGYIYDNPPPYGLGQIFADRTDMKFGTVHGDDMSLIFKTDIRKDYPFSEDEERISKNLINMLVHMAKTGVPIYDGVELRSLKPENNFSIPKITKEGIFYIN